MPFATKLEKQEYLDKKEDRKERRRIANKKYSDKNKEKKSAYAKKRYAENPEKIKLINDKWNKDNPVKYKKIGIIGKWKERGIISDDYNFVYDIYLDTTNCNFCNNKFKNTTDRCLDHDHDIINSNNIRGILCRVCNIKDKLKGCPPIF